MNLNDLTIKKAIDLIEKKEITPLDIIDESIRLIEEDNKKSNKLNAVLYTSREKAQTQINQLSKDAPLKGLPIIIKDNMNYKGFPIHCASKMLEGYISPYTATFLEKLNKGGAVVYGVANMDEFAFGSSNETSAYGIARNPIHRDYVPGGSSGGSASVVGSHQAICSLGSDTGGSIRQPASFCGIVGLKSTYGRVSRYGLVAFGSSLDQAGPITKTVEDAAILLEHMAGHDPKDATTLKIPVDKYTHFIDNPIKGKRIALVKDSFASYVDPDIQRAIAEVRDFYTKQGCIIDVVEDMSVFMDSLRCYYIIAVAEVMSNLSRFDSIRYGKRQSENDLEEIYHSSRTNLFGTEVKRRIVLGNFLLQKENYNDFFQRATDTRVHIIQKTNELFKTYDAILSPTTGDKVFKFGSKLKSDNPLDMYMSDIFSVYANISKTPSISVPCGTDSNGMPISFSLTGNYFDEKTILNMAHIYNKSNLIQYKVGN